MPSARRFSKALVSGPVVRYGDGVMEPRNLVAQAVRLSGMAVAAAVVLVGIVLLGWRIFHPVAKPAASPTMAEVTPTPAETPVFGPAGKQLPGGTFEPSDPRWAEVHAKEKADKNWAWKVPVNFYGRVVDEQGAPVAGASVNYRLTDLSEAGKTEGELKSDAQGNFSLRGKVGRILTVVVAKPGYYLSQRENADGFDFSSFWEKNYYVPDPQAPVIFHLRKKGVAANLVTGQIEATLPANGDARQIPLSEKAADTWARLVVRAWTNTQDPAPMRFDWRVILSVPDGDLQPCMEEFPFFAPDAGYVEALEVNMPTTAEHWRRGIDQMFYVRYKNPLRYGRIRVQIDGASQNITVQVWLNPEPEDRNLEPPEGKP